MERNGFCCRPICCSSVILGILFALLIGTIGLILGAAFSAVILANLAVFIVAAVLLAIILLVYLLSRFCFCRRNM
ncbi:MAG: hypothetical protein Q4B04_01000 [bacterium]|nr:hypothetical protein [bacterium]